MQIKTAISIQETLFRQVNMIALKTKISRSRLFEEAIREFIQKYQNSNQKLFQQLNRAYDDMPDNNEKKQQKFVKFHQQKLLEGQW